MNGLVLGGGGVKGAFEVGAVECLSTKYGLDFNVIAGVSTGALIATFVCLDEFEKLNDIYLNIQKHHIIKQNILPNTIYYEGIYDTSPMEHMIEQYVDVDYLCSMWPFKRLFIKTANIRSGELHCWTNRPNHKKYYKKALLAAASMPVLMNQVLIDGDMHGDAGIRDVAPVTSAINQGCSRVYVITTSPDMIAPLEKNPSNIVSILGRTIDIMLAEILQNDIYQAQSINRLVGLEKYIVGIPIPELSTEIIHIRPSEDLNADALDFDKADKEKMWLAGWDAAEKAMENLNI